MSSNPFSSLRSIAPSFDTLASYPVLVIGAGGLGCELLKCLACSGFRSISVVDLDTVDVSNLNRQFLFRDKDIGQSKAIAAARAVEQRCPGVQVTAYHTRIQQLPDSFYKQFKVVVAGLDNIEARRYLNAMLVSLVQFDADGDPDPDSVIPLIDGGTEAFKGHCRVIVPRLSGCFECALPLFPPPVVFAQCTIVNTPRNAAHCVAYAQYLWESDDAHEPLDKDDVEQMLWVLERAREHARKFNIAEEITLQKAKGVVGNIIPAIASTNAIVAAAQVNELVKIATGAADPIDNYLMYNGSDGAYGLVLSMEREKACAVCGSRQASVTVARQETVSRFLERLEQLPQFQLKRPSVKVIGAAAIWMPSEATREQFAPNLERRMSDFVDDGGRLAVSDPSMMVHIEMTVHMEGDTRKRARKA